MAILNRDDLVPDDIQREKRMREFRQRAWKILREEKERDEQLYQADILLDRIKEGDA